MDLTAAEVRVLGALVEKERTTSENYPLTTNALVAACNQRTSRDPVTDYDERAVDEAMRELRQRGLARTIRGSGMRTYKHRHVLHEAWHLSTGELAVIALLALRGPQTPGELRARSDRYAGATADGDVDAVLSTLAARDDPLVVNLGRAPGQSQDRWAHLLSGAEAAVASGRATPMSSTGSVPHRPSAPSRVDELARKVEQLEARLARLEQALGVEGDEGGA